MESNWYLTKDAASIDSPALLIYVDRVKQNIDMAIGMTGEVERLRPHVKTHKSPQVCRMMLDAGIRKFKCATIAEAEMLAAANAKDILLAYQPVGPKLNRLLDLVEDFPETTFACLIDDLEAASEISAACIKHQVTLDVFVDLNSGMNRTGITPEEAFALIDTVRTLKGICLKGLHAYDGHLRDGDFAERKRKCDEGFKRVTDLQAKVKEAFQLDLTIIAGGTPTFSIHSKRRDIECSPGTFIYWDTGYDQILAEQTFEFAAVLLTRVVSKPAPGVICVDLGHKAVASENPLEKRVRFLNAPGLKPLSHSEEHMTFDASDHPDLRIGDVLYGVPYHVCPTVALHDQVSVIRNGVVYDQWTNISRTRKITV